MRQQPEYKMLLVRELRQRETPSEALLWQHLRGRKLDSLKFRRQRPLDRYIADFCCDDVRLIVEVDGSIHDESEHQETDAERQAHLTAIGYTVLRVSANDVMNSLPLVIRRIREAAGKSRSKADAATATGSPLPAAGEGPGVRGDAKGANP